MRDFLTDQTGDIEIDPSTHDIAWISGADEIAQRIRATLRIYYGEMPNLAPNQGTKYNNFFVKNIHENVAKSDMVNAIEANVPEVNSVQDINFIKLPDRKLKVTFKASVTVSDGSQDIAEGGVTIGN